MSDRQEFIRSLLTEDGMIDFDHPIFEKEKHVSEKTEMQVITDALEKVSWDELSFYLLPEEIVKNLKYLTYERLGDFLIKLSSQYFMNTENVSEDIFKGLAERIVFEESNTNSPGNLIQYIYDYTQIISTNFLKRLVNEVAKMYSNENMVYEGYKESNFLSFFTKFLYNDIYDKVERVLNKVILEMIGEERVRFDIEYIPDFCLYSDLIKNAESFSRDVSNYGIRHVTDDDILDTYLELHDRLREEMGLSVQKDDSEEILETTVKISDIIKKFK